MSGYARFHRSLIGHPAFRNDAEAMAFAYMVLRAQWKPVRVRYKGKALSLNRGQLAMSVRDLADAMDRDKGWVRAALKTFRKMGLIESRRIPGLLVITVTDFEQYAATEGADPDPMLRFYSPAPQLDVREAIPRSLRDAVFARDDGRCRYCGSQGPFHIDHVIPWASGGPTEIDNLVLACVPCNLSKGARTPGEWRR